MKKIICVAVAVLLVVCVLTSCQENTSAQDGGQQDTVTGRITDIEGSVITIDQMGPGAVQSGDSESGGIPEKPDGDAAEMPQGTDGEKPQMPEGSSGEAPEKPDGGTGEIPEMPQGTEGEIPEMPQGTDGEMPQMPGGESGTDETGGGFNPTSVRVTIDMGEVDISGISVGDTVIISYENGEPVSIEKTDMGGMQPGGGMQSGADASQGTAAAEITEDSDIDGESYKSETADENAVRITGAGVTMSDITAEKLSGDTSDTESANFYGMNAALLATDGAAVTIDGAEIESDVSGGNAVFSYGNGTCINISSSEISTSGDNSGGLMAAGGGEINATDVKASTAGRSAAAVRSDRGGGVINVNGGSYESSGYDSPAVYSTADITVNDAELSALNSEAIVVEGSNSVELNDCSVYGNMSAEKGTSSSINVHNVIIYQSMSGDAEEGTASFSMTGGTLSSDSGDMFYVTNTDCTINLESVSVINCGSDVILRVCGNDASKGWGKAGSNGGNAVFTASSQTLVGDIIVDTVSTLGFILENGSVFTGTVCISDNEENGTAVDDNAVVTVGKGCTWNLTGNCTVTSLVNNGTINFNGHTITLADGTVLS